MLQLVLPWTIILIFCFGLDAGLFGSITGAVSGWFHGTGDNTLLL